MRKLLRKFLKSDHQKLVEKMMRKAEQELNDLPTMPVSNTRNLRARLILEESLETIKALGFEIGLKKPKKISKLQFKDFILQEKSNYDSDAQENLENIVDGCADLIVVTTGCLSACGVPDLPILGEVDRNNLKKFKHGFFFRDDGKLIKPPNHKPPNIRKILNSLNN